jgi:nitrate reductase NapAB chaperone NapD
MRNKLKQIKNTIRSIKKVEINKYDLIYKIMDYRSSGKLSRLEELENILINSITYDKVNNTYSSTIRIREDVLFRHGLKIIDS